MQKSIDIPDVIDAGRARFRTADEVRSALQQACATHPELARFEEIGRSEEGRSIDAVLLGQGERTVSLIAGAHADEPAGPETLRELVLQGLAQHEGLQDLFAHFKFAIVPQINPDGEARNQVWIRAWPEIEAYLQYVMREPPGRDLEFGFPNMRPENRAVADFLRAQAPISLHLSLHGMAFAEGAMLLIERHWAERTKVLRTRFVEAAEQAKLGLHDQDRGGEKGFHYLGAGFWTTPEGEAMRAHFNAQGDAATAALFRDSSMEFVRKLGGGPLSLVTEIPLFLIRNKPAGTQPGVPAAYLVLKKELPLLKRKIERGESISSIIQQFGIEPVPLATAVRLQLCTLQLGLEVIG